MLLLAWLVAVLIRLATGSATVATITAAGILAPLVADISTRPHAALLVLAIGAGSLFFSHVNDAGFWLVKEYFGLTRRPDTQDLVGDGDADLGRRPGRSCCCWASWSDGERLRGRPASDARRLPFRAAGGRTHPA